MQHSCNTSKPVITCTDVSFTENGTTILSDISFTIHHGDYVMIVGENGSGKSTLIKIILGLLTPDKGSVTVSPCADATHPHIGFVPQNATFVDPLFPVTVREVVRMGIRHANTGTTTAIENVLTRVGLAHKINTPLQKLSGGEKQRAFLARALVSNPDILILDEPTVGISQSGRDSFYKLLEELHTEKCKTVMLVTHDTELAAQKSTHAIRIADGHAYYHEDPQTLAKGSHDHHQ